MEQSIEKAEDIRKVWVNELHQLKKQLDNNDRLFNMTSDFDITDYTIHKRTALFAQYRYLIKCIRDFDKNSPQNHTNTENISIMCLDKERINL